MPAHTSSSVVGALASHQFLSLTIGVGIVPQMIPLVASAFRNDLNITFGGKGHLAGIVKIGTTLVSRKVRLTEASTGVLISEMWSAADGSWRFDRLRTDLLYTVSSHDFDNGYNDVIAANARAVL